jgi:diguanylate cyclase
MAKSRWRCKARHRVREGQLENQFKNLDTIFIRRGEQESRNVNPLIYTILWVLPSILLALGIGYYLGRTLGRHEREQTLRSLAGILQSTEELTHNVDTHNTELAEVGITVNGLQIADELGGVQEALVSQIDKVVKSNRKLENDLICARHELQEQERELHITRHEARTDQLSGVANRKSFEESLTYWLANAERSQEYFALVLCDIDHFKWVNDTHGHHAGDCVVSDVGRMLQNCLRGEDFVARYGGDEFVLLLRGADVNAAVAVSERIRKTAERLNFKAARLSEELAITFSMGLAMAHSGDTRESLLKRADEALYKAKEAGRNCLKVDSTDTLATDAPPSSAPAAQEPQGSYAV